MTVSGFWEHVKLSNAKKSLKILFQNLFYNMAFEIASQSIKNCSFYIIFSAIPEASLVVV